MWNLQTNGVFVFAFLFESRCRDSRRPQLIQSVLPPASEAVAAGIIAAEVSASLPLTISVEGCAAASSTNREANITTPCRGARPPTRCWAVRPSARPGLMLQSGMRHRKSTDAGVILETNYVGPAAMLLPLNLPGDQVPFAAATAIAQVNHHGEHAEVPPVPQAFSDIQTAGHSSYVAL
jgi:hypothetical protein